MKHTLLFVAMTMAALTAQAQRTVKGAGFFDNWSIGVNAGGITPLTHSSFTDDMRVTYGLELSKQVTPVVGLGFQYMVAHNVSPSLTAIDASNLSLLGKFNLSNLFAGYNGKRRVFELEAVAGAGWGHHFYNESWGDDANYFTTKFGLNLNLSPGKLRAWTFALKPAVVYHTENRGEHNSAALNANRAAFELTAGLTYHFKNANNKRHYMTLQRPYDQGEVDALNAKVNDLRAQLNDRDAELARQRAELRDVQQQLNDCRDKKPIVETRTITNNTQSLEQTVTFRQGKSVIDASQLPNVERVATFMRNHPKSTVSIKGYASPEGSAEINAKIALARAEAVKSLLVNKYHIAADRISAEGQGVGDLFSEPDWNRVSICTINEAD